MTEFISSSEFAQVDYGVYVGDEDLDEQEPTARLYNTVRDYFNDKVVLPIECKFSTAHLRSRTSYTYVLIRTKNQIGARVSAIAVGSIVRPRLMAFVPTFYLDKDFMTRKPDKNRQWRAQTTYLGMARPPPFAMELSPFAMKLTDSEKMVNSWTDYHHNASAIP